MNSELRTRLMDYLDGLLEPEAEAAVVELLAGDEEAVAELERVKHLRAAIYKPGKVPEPHGALKERVFREIGEAPRRRHVMRHVASFAAGVLTTFGLLSLLFLLIHQRNLSTTSRPICRLSTNSNAAT